MDWYVGRLASLATRGSLNFSLSYTVAYHFMLWMGILASSGVEPGHDCITNCNL